jgi:hypothetical protein
MTGRKGMGQEAPQLLLGPFHFSLFVFLIFIVRSAFYLLFQEYNCPKFA